MHITERRLRIADALESVVIVQGYKQPSQKGKLEAFQRNNNFKDTQRATIPIYRTEMLLTNKPPIELWAQVGAKPLAQ